MSPANRARATCLSCGSATGDAPVCATCGEPTGPPERKVVTVLFADLVGYTDLCSRLDPEEVFEVVRPAMTSLRRVVESYGGSVPQLLGDGFMAVFGVPQAHEDDPARAVHAAAALHDRLGQLNAASTLPLPPLRVGVETGEVFVAASRELSGFSVSGTTVNLASRLCDLAGKGRSLIGPHAADLVREVAKFQRVRSRRVRGLPDPVPTYELREVIAPDRRRRSAGAAPFVGRADELAYLHAALDSVMRTGRSDAVLVVGDAGQGKSRLLDEFVSRRRDIVALVGACSSYGEKLPYSGLADAVAGFLGVAAPCVDGERLSAAVLGATSTLLPAVSLFIADSLRVLLGAGGGDRGDSVEGARLLVETLAAQRPVVLVLDDLHWGRDDLEDVVASAAAGRWHGPILVLGAARPDTDAAGVPTLTVPPLPPVDMATIVAGLLGPGVDRVTTSQLLQRAGGNPLFVEECAAVLRDSSIRASVTGEASSPDASRPNRIPQSMRLFIAARLDALPADEKAGLQRAAVLGERAWLPALGPHGAAVPSLVGRGLLREVEPSLVPGVAEYAFRHTLIREVAYESVPWRLRAEWHRAAADWLVSLQAGHEQFRAPLSLLAHHYHRAWQNRRPGDGGDDCELARAAVEHLHEWAEELHRREAVASGSAYASALEVAAAAAACIDGRTRAALHIGHARTAAEVGRYDVADAEFDTAVTVAVSAGDPALQAEALVAQAMARSAQGRLDASERALAGADALADTVRSPRLDAARALCRARNQRFRDLPRLPWSLRDAYQAHEAAGDERGAYDIAHELAYVQTMDGGADFERWRSITASRTSDDDLRGSAQMLRTDAYLAWNRRELEDAFALASAAFDRARTAGSHHVEADALLCQATCCALLGRLDEADELLARLHTACDAGGWRRMRALAGNVAARVALRRGQPGRAADLLRTADAELTALGVQFERLDVQIAALAVDVERGQWTGADAAAATILDALEPAGWGLYAMPARLDRARAALGAGREDAVELLATCVDAARRHAAPQWAALASGLLEQAQLLGGVSASTTLHASEELPDVRAIAAENEGLRSWRAGDGLDAATWFADAAARWSDLGQTVWFARALIWQATASGTSAALADAMTVLADVGAPDGLAHTLAEGLRASHPSL